MIGKKAKIFALIIICFICYLVGVSWTILPSISNILLIDLLSEKQYAVLSFSLVLAAVMFSNIAGLLGKKWGLKKIINSGTFFAFIGVFIVVLSTFFSKQIFSILLVGQFILGLGLSFILTSITAYLCLSFPNLSAMTLTAIFACINLGSISGPLFFNLKIFQDWWFNCLIISILWFVFFVSSLKALPVVKNPHSALKHRNIFSRKFTLFWLFFLVILLYSLCEYTYAFWGIVLLSKIKGFDLIASRYGLAIFWAAVGIAQITIFFLLKYKPAKFFYRILPIFIFSGFFILSYASKYYNNIIGLIIGGLGCSAFVALSLSFVEKFFKEIAEISAGIMFTGYFLGYILGSLFIGQSINYISLNTLFVIAGIIAIFIEILVMNLLIKTKRST
ncbi:MAG: MFS transporter [Parachlamydiales bacterium]